MSPDIGELIRGMSPGALRLYKTQLAELPDEEKQRTFSRLSGIPELSDITGSKTIDPGQLQQEQSQEQVRMPWEIDKTAPWWSQGLQYFGMPFQTVSKAFGAAVTSPWTDATPETQAMPWWKKELTEYEQTKMPWGVKGALEIAPWLALPGIGAVGKAGQAGRGVAGMLGRTGQVGRVAGKALEASPWGLAEKATGAALKPIGRILSKAIGTTKTPVPSAIWAKLTKTERSVVAEEMGLAEGIGSRSWSRLGKKNQDIISEAILHPEKIVDKAPVEKIVPEVTPRVAPKVISKLVPEGFEPAQEASISKLTELVKKAELRTKATLAERTPEQARRIGKFEDFIEQNLQRGDSPEIAMGKAEAALRTQLPQAEADALLTTIRQGLTETDINNLFGIVANLGYKSGYDRLNTFTSLQDLLLNNVMQRNQIARLEETFGSGLAKTLLGKRAFGVKAGELAIDLANAPRALLASMDISGLLRQGAILSARHPIEALKTVQPMLRAMFSDKNMMLMDDVTRARKGMDELIDAGLDITALPTKLTAQITQREEAFASSIMNKIPFVKASNRAYVQVLNDMRSRSALNVLNNWKRAGIKYNKQDLTDLARLTNWASGRGTLPGFMSKQSGLMSALFFSPKLIASRLELPTTVLPSVTKSALVRKEAWRTFLSFIGAGAGILAMSRMSGQVDKLELDPRSADFGKMKIGETRLDIWSGYTQYLRFMAQLATAQRKTSGGRIQILNRGEVIERFARSKLSPATGLLTDLIKGETYLGEALPPKSAKSVFGQIYQRMMPLAIQDMIDASEQDGIAGGLISSWGLLGVGVVTYTDEVKRARDKAAKEQYGMSWEEVGQKLGRTEQLKLEQTEPNIIEAEQEQEERFATGTPNTTQQWYNEGQGIEDTYRETVELASKEYRATGDGITFREKINNAANYRRQAYSSRSKRPEYQEIVDYYNQPLDQAKIAEMNPGDVIRREYYQQMFSLDMYDEYGNYDFNKAEQKEQEFLTKYGQQALDYIEEYSGARWMDKPVELKTLEQARDTLRPYWQVADQIWSMYPTELKTLSDQIMLMERTDPDRARAVLRRYPQILRARELIARQKKQMRSTNRTIDMAFRMYY